MSGKIWAFGCSQTYGHGLKDCIKEGNAPGDEPSKFAYPQLIGNALNKEVINLSRPGASNKHMLRKIKIFQSEMSVDDIVLIGWTNKDRHIILKEGIDLDDMTMHGLPHPIGLHPTQIGKSKLADTYYKHIHDDNDANIVTMWYMNYAYLTLKEMGIKSIHCPVQPNKEEFSNSSFWSYFSSQTSDSKFEVGMSLLSKTFLHPDIAKLDKALDNLHQGPKSHRVFADLIITEFLTQ
jgi:hypothetical protein